MPEFIVATSVGREALGTSLRVGDKVRLCNLPLGPKFRVRHLLSKSAVAGHFLIRKLCRSVFKSDLKFIIKRTHLQGNSWL